MRKVLKQFIWDVVGSYSFRSIKRRQGSEHSLVGTKSSCSTRLGGESRVKGVKWSVRLTKKSLILFADNLVFMVSPRN